MNCNVPTVRYKTDLDG